MRPEQVQHGTERGYQWHKRNRVHACKPCLEAHAQESANRRASKAKPSRLGQALDEARSHAGLTPDQVAERLGWSSPYSIDWIANGSRRVSLQTLEEWAALLGCRIEVVPVAPAPAVQDKADSHD